MASPADRTFENAEETKYCKIYANYIICNVTPIAREVGMKQKSIAEAARKCKHKGSKEINKCIVKELSE